MKKLGCLLVFALTLWLGLAVPTGAADVSGMDAATKQAYYTVLTSQIEQYGIVESSGSSGLEYAALDDMDGNGTPELIAIRYTSEGSAYICIWTMKNGKAVQTVNEEIYSGGVYTEASIFLVRQTGRVAVCDSYRWYDRELSCGEGGWLVYTVHYADGTTDVFRADEKSEREAIQAAFERTWKADHLQFFGGLNLWLHKEEAGQAVRQLQTDLTVQETNTSDENNTYTVTGYEHDGSFYTIIFEVTSVEKKTLMVTDDGLFTNGWEPTRATLVSVRPGSTIRATGGTTIAPDFSNSNEPGVAAMIGWMNGLNCSMTGQSGANILNGPTSKTFRDGNEVYRLWTTDRDGDPIFVCLGKETATVGGFTDVKADAYYADAVAWAVDREITSGTSTTTFSPNNTCTTAQILTFLWRASGSPAVSESNPFSDVSADAYYYQAALWAREKGLVSGSAFRGNIPCTRAATVTYLWKLAGRPSVGASSFTDVPAGAGYAQAVAWAVNEGITSGTGDQKFSPDTICTRGQIMTFIYRDMVG